MQKMTSLAIFAGIALFAGLVVLILAANPIVALFGKVVLAVAIMGFAATATTFVMDRSVEVLAFRKQGFHWN